MAVSENRHRAHRHRLQFRATPDGAAGRSCLGRFQAKCQLLLLEPLVLPSTDVSGYGGKQRGMIEDDAGPNQD